MKIGESYIVFFFANCRGGDVLNLAEHIVYIYTVYYVRMMCMTILAFPVVDQCLLVAKMQVQRMFSSTFVSHLRWY